MAHDYLTVADVLSMHTVLMQRYGGAPGLRDPGALEAALFRPQTGYYEDIVAEAAALLESLAINYPFVDGNKRIAFAAADVFLRLEHDGVATLLTRARELTDHYVPPDHACMTWRALFNGLSELEADLKRHIHLENNILFPRALMA